MANPDPIERVARHEPGFGAVYGQVGPGAEPVPAVQVAVRDRSLDALRIILFVLVILTLSRLHLHLGLTRFRLALLLGMGAGALAILHPRAARWRDLFRTWPPKAVVALAVIACFSAAFGISLGGAARYILENFSKVLVLFTLILVATRDYRDLRTFMWAYVVSCGILVYYALVVFDLSVASGSATARLAGLYTYDSNDIGCILVSGLPLALLLFQSSKALGRIVAGTVLLGIGAAVALSGSRGTFLGLVGVGFGLLLFVPGVSGVKRMGTVFAVVLALAVVAPAGYWEQMRTIVEPTQDYNWTTYYGRKQTAERAIDYMFRYPVAGIGIGNFSRAEGQISERARTFDPSSGDANRWRAAHNSFLQAGAELGIPGLFVWSSLVFGCMIGIHRLRRGLPRAWLRGGPSDRFLYLAAAYLPIAFAGFAITSFFVSFAWLDPLYLLVAFAAGVYLLASERMPAKSRPAGRATAGYRGHTGHAGHRMPNIGKVPVRRGRPHPSAMSR